jgi:hypothetical protein
MSLTSLTRLADSLYFEPDINAAVRVCEPRNGEIAINYLHEGNDMS